MMRAVLVAALALAGCTAPHSSAPHLPTPAPVSRPPCALPPAPAFPDSDAALATAAGLAERVLRLRAGRDARIDYERELRAACH